MNRLQKGIQDLYNIRFSDKERENKRKMWQVLCSDFLQQFIAKDTTVIDLAAGYCEFINQIKCKNKIAIDINPRTKSFANKDVKIVSGFITKLPGSLTKKADVVFCSNLLEHLSSKEEILQVFSEVWRILKPGGYFIILNPNIRFSTSDYWDYFDHLSPISDRSAVEGLKLTGFKIRKVIPKFVPNTIKDRLPKSVWLVKIYLHLPILFPIFGRQMFIISQK